MYNFNHKGRYSLPLRFNNVKTKVGWCKNSKLMAQQGESGLAERVISRSTAR